MANWFMYVCTCVHAHVCILCYLFILHVCVSMIKSLLAIYLHVCIHSPLLIVVVVVVVVSQQTGELVALKKIPLKKVDDGIPNSALR